MIEWGLSIFSYHRPDLEHGSQRWNSTECVGAPDNAEETKVRDDQRGERAAREK